MSPIEVVARAVYERSHHCEPYEACPEWWVGIARAALTALRDNGVTAKMFLAWNDAHGPADEFRAMLDAALNVGNGE